MNIQTTLCEEFKLKSWQIDAVIQLIEQGNTIPFIARYRKEKHGSLDDQLLRSIADRYEQLQKINARSKEIRDSLEALGVLDEKISAQIDAATTLSQLQDIYRPFRPKRKTRASIAKAKGLEPFAAFLLQQKANSIQLEEKAASFVDTEKGVTSIEQVIQGGKDIIAEKLSDNAQIRTALKALYQTFSFIHTTAVKGADNDSVYQMYFDKREPLRQIPSHRVLAINRGENEGILKVHMDINVATAVRILEKHVLISENNASVQAVREACEDAFDRLIAPSIENELRSELTERAQKDAIHVFAMNLRPLLMQPPLKNQTVIGLDPGIRTGCKVAVIDSTGKVLDTGVIYPLPAQKRVEQAKQKVKAWIKKWNVKVAAIGNGTAGRETEHFFVEVMHELQLGDQLAYVIVNEAGASVYSASKLAAEEFPQYDVTIRSAISIARRLQDPLAELVKIDPKSIGVGQYQHDLKVAELDKSLDNVIEDCVNAVGVNLNTASASLLSHVSGINASIAKNIVKYREDNGAFNNRNQLKKVAKLGPKAFEQCAGFLRIPDSADPLENTGVHPESYGVAKALLKSSVCDTSSLKSLSTDELSKLAQHLNTGVPTLVDIINELGKPGRDPRDELPKPLLRSDVLEMEDLVPGMELSGTVRNVTDFGAFVDIGVHQDGLVHVSEFANRNLKHPNQAVSVGDVVRVWVKDVDIKRKRIALTMRKSEETR